METYHERRRNAEKIKEDIEKGTQLWNYKILEISERKVNQAGAKVEANRRESLEQQKKRRMKKEEIFRQNYENIQTMQDIERRENLKLIRAKDKKAI